jgi:hypothetical protein
MGRRRAGIIRAQNNLRPIGVLVRIPDALPEYVLKVKNKGAVLMLQDIRFGLKLLWKQKAFSFAALLTLAH